MLNEVNEYGKALFLISEEDDIIDDIYSQINIVMSLFLDNNEYEKILDTPAIKSNEKHCLIEEAFKGFNPILVDFIKLLSDKCMAHTFSKAVKTYNSMYDEFYNIERVAVTTVLPLTEVQTEALKSKFESITGKTIIVENEIDPKILGGVKIRFSDSQLDGTFKKMLDDFSGALRNTVI